MTNCAKEDTWETYATFFRLELQFQSVEFSWSGTRIVAGYLSHLNQSKLLQLRFSALEYSQSVHIYS